MRSILFFLSLLVTCASVAHQYRFPPTDYRSAHPTLLPKKEPTLLPKKEEPRFVVTPTTRFYIITMGDFQETVDSFLRLIGEHQSKIAYLSDAMSRSSDSERDNTIDNIFLDIENFKPDVLVLFGDYVFSAVAFSEKLPKYNIPIVSFGNILHIGSYNKKVPVPVLYYWFTLDVSKLVDSLAKHLSKKKGEDVTKILVLYSTDNISLAYKENLLKNLSNWHGAKQVQVLYTVQEFRKICFNIARNKETVLIIDLLYSLRNDETALYWYRNHITKELLTYIGDKPLIGIENFAGTSTPFIVEYDLPIQDLNFLPYGTYSSDVFYSINYDLLDPSLLLSYFREDSLGKSLIRVLYTGSKK